MVKVGDKVRVMTRRHGLGCPDGSVQTISGTISDGEGVIVSAGGFSFYLYNGEYEPFPFDERIPADNPDPRDDPSNPDKLPLSEMSDRVIAMIVRAGISNRDVITGFRGAEWEKSKTNVLCATGCYRLHPRTVRIEYDCDENGKPIMETGREVG